MAMKAGRTEVAEEEDISCDLCNVHPSSVQDLQAHLRGRSHQMMVHRAEVAKRSMYVRGFPASTSSIETELKTLMQQFGGVVSVAMVTTDTDCYALVEFVNAESSLRALQHSSGLSLHSHILSIRPRLLKSRKLPRRNVVIGRKKRLDVAVATKDVTMKEEKEKEMEEEEEEEEEVVGGIRLTEEAITALSQSNTINSQLEILAYHCRHKASSAEDQLLLAWKLTAKLRPLFPSCIIIPFGAPFSGHGTLSSDCDLCLISQPSPLDISLFTGPSYLPPYLHHLLERSDLTSLPPTTASVCPVVADNDPGMKDVLTILQSDPQFSNVWALHSARVPIIRFTFDLLHCDLSFNNRLGPANTQLLAAYMNFDPRMAVMVPCVRLWIRGCGLGRSQLNNYAVSLLLIHCLQQTSPPVLPCLQELGVWPRNMTWFESKGKSREKEVELDGWKCSFTDPESLLPSSNIASPAELLLQFLKYYTEEFSFSEKIVTIHTLLSPPVPMTTSNQIPGFRVSALNIQDPFERCHNVTKSVTVAHCQRLLHSMQQSYHTLSELLTQQQIDCNVRQNILLLFRSSAHSSEQPQSLPEHTVYLTLQTVAKLLHSSSFSWLESRLEQLNLTNPAVCQRLSHVILHALTHHLQDEFGFRVQFHQENVTVPTTTAPSSPLPAVPDSQCSVNVRKRPLEEEEEVGEEEMEVEGGGEEQVKRQRLHHAESAEEVLFRQTEGQSIACRAICVAERETWVGRRRRRRQGPKPPHQELPSPNKPCLSFTLSVFITTDHTHTDHAPTTGPIKVVLQAMKREYKLDFELFYSVCKKRFFT